MCECFLLLRQVSWTTLLMIVTAGLAVSLAFVTVAVAFVPGKVFNVCGTAPQAGSLSPSICSTELAHCPPPSPTTTITTAFLWCIVHLLFNFVCAGFVPPRLPCRLWSHRLWDLRVRRQRRPWCRHPTMWQGRCWTALDCVRGLMYGGGGEVWEVGSSGMCVLSTLNPLPPFRFLPLLPVPCVARRCPWCGTRKCSAS